MKIVYLKDDNTYLTNDLKGYVEGIKNAGKEKHVFLISRYSDFFNKTKDKIIDLFKQYKLNVIVANDVRKSGDVSNNILVCALSCKYGIILLDEPLTKDERKNLINPNVAFELGFMRHFSTKENLFIAVDKKVNIDKYFADIKDYDRGSYESANTTDLLCKLQGWIHKNILEKKNELSSPNFDNLNRWNLLEDIGSDVTTRQGYEMAGISKSVSPRSQTPSKKVISCVNQSCKTWNGRGQHIKFSDPKPSKVIFGCWSQVKGVLTKGLKGDYGVEVDIFGDANFPAIYPNATFSPKEKEWQFKVKEIDAGRPISELYYYVLFRGFSGRVLFANAFLIRAD